MNAPLIWSSYESYAYVNCISIKTVRLWITLEAKKECVFDILASLEKLCKWAPRWKIAEGALLQMSNFVLLLRKSQHVGLICWQLIAKTTAIFYLKRGANEMKIFVKSKINWKTTSKLLLQAGFVSVPLLTIWGLFVGQFGQMRFLSHFFSSLQRQV